MAKGEPKTANDAVSRQLEVLSGRLEERLEGHVIAYCGSIYPGADAAIRDAVESRHTRKSKLPKLAFLLDTPGGLIESAQRIATVLREHYRRVEFFVPDAAMSAGTVLVMSGDAIHMDYYSTLGPIDPQLRREGRYVPALGYLKKYAELMEKASKGGLNTAETTYLCTKFDPAQLYQYEQQREMSVFLLETWLAKYKFWNWKKTRTHGRKVTPKMRRDRAKRIGEQLNDTDEWHSHGHGISMEVLRRKLKLEIDDFGRDPELHAEIRGYWHLFTDYMAKLGKQHALHTIGRYSVLS